jgi:putative ABC transport system ATP-binding protein
VNKPSIILADEPTGNLDTKTSEELWNFSMIFMKGNTVILVTHEEKPLTPRIIRLRDGMIESDISK